MVRIDGESDAAEIPENGCMVEDGFNPRVERREKVERTGDERFISERWCHFGIWFDFFPGFLPSALPPSLAVHPPPNDSRPFQHITEGRVRSISTGRYWFMQSFTIRGLAQQYYVFFSPPGSLCDVYQLTNAAAQTRCGKATVWKMMRISANRSNMPGYGVST